MEVGKIIKPMAMDNFIIIKGLYIRANGRKTISKV